MHHRARQAPRRTRTAAATVLVAVAGALAVPACGLGDKAGLEQRITSAPARYEGMVVAGTISVESRLKTLPSGVGIPGALGPPGVSAPPGLPSAPTTQAELPTAGVPLGALTVGFVLDLEGSRAALLADAAATEPQVVFDDLVLYGRRGGVPADDARPWVRLDLDDLDDTAGALDPLDGAGPNALYALHPAVLADLVAGTLTGSIEPGGDDSLGAGTTHYEVNISIRKALQDTRRARYPERRRESAEELLRLLGVVGDLHPGAVWLDAEGRIRRFRIEFRQEPRHKVEFRMIVSVDVGPTPTEPPTAFQPPGADQVLGVDSVLRFTSTVVATGDGEDGAASDAPAAAPTDDGAVVDPPPSPDAATVP